MRPLRALLLLASVGLAAAAKDHPRHTHPKPKPGLRPGEVHQGTLDLKYLADFSASADYPDAVCNDGTTGAFYHANASDPAKAHLWVVMQEGGQWCGCAGRSYLPDEGEG